MDNTEIIQWTIISVGIALAMFGFAVAWGMLRLIRAEVKAEIAGLRAEINASISQLRADMNAGNSQLRADMNAGNSQLRADMDAGNSQLRGEATANTSRLDAGISELRHQIVAIRQMLARFALHRHGDDGLPVAPLTDALDPPEGTAGGNREGDGSGN